MFQTNFGELTRLKNDLGHKKKQFREIHNHTSIVSVMNRKNNYIMKKTFTLKFIALNMVLLCSALLSFGQTVTTGTDGVLAGTLRNQIAAAAPNATITIANTVNSITLVQGQITINKSLTITSNATPNTDITTSLSRIFDVTAGTLTINNVKFSNGSAADGGAIQIENASVTLNNCILDNNIANASNGSGGAIYVKTGANLTANNSTFSNNRANRAGGAIEAVAGTTITLNNVDFLNNNAGVFPATAAPGNGGALHITGAGTANIMGGTVSNNQAAAEGGGLWNGSGTMTLDSVTIVNNSAAGAGADNGGGGLYNLNNGTLNIENSTITNNSATGAAGSGGGILTDVDATLNIMNSTITNNMANRAGGGIEGRAVGGTNMIVLNNVDLSSNVVANAPGNGGGLHMTGPGTIDVTNSTIANNAAGSEGGGLWNGSGTMTIDSTTISGNSAAGVAADNGGGGIYNLNGGTLSITNSTITNNDASGTAGSGGGILNDVGSQLSIINTKITGNTAKRAGGGIEDNSGTSTIILTDVNLDSNSVASAPGNGGGLHITGGGSATIMGGTVNNNSASREGGGLWNGGGLMTVTNTKVNNNIALGATANDGGAGIFNNGGDLMLNNVELKNNMSTGASASGGGLLSLNGDITIMASTFENNAANRAGGAIEIIDGMLTITNSTFMQNDVDGLAGTPAPGNGGAIHITGVTTATIDSSSFMGNAAGREGGALWNQNGSTMDITFTTIDGNVSNGDGATFGGGGIFNSGGALTVSNSAITNNKSMGATGNGGGLHVKNGTAMIMTTTISGNTSANHGGGIYNNAELDLNAVTIANNSATADGGGIASEGTIATEIKNSIVATNMGTTNDVFTSGALYTSNGYNLIGETMATTIVAATGDIFGTSSTPINPMLGALALNGGLTQTQMLMSGSPAYNTGDATDVFNDQNDNTVFDGTRDMGAAELQAYPTAVNDITNAGINLALYPNPNNGTSITVDLKDFKGTDIQARVIEITTGKTVQSFKLQSNKNELTLNKLTSGLYIMSIQSGSTVSTHKFTVQ